MFYNVIPARAGSKRFPKKNRELLPYTLDSIPESEYERTIITSDDSWIKNQVKESEIKFLERDPSLAGDEASVKDVLISVAEKMEMGGDDKIVLMYLTYPGRTHQDVSGAIDFYENHDSASLLCRQPVASHPYLCMHEEENGRGSQIIDHELYRYQDYPEVFEISHYLGILKVSELSNLNPNLYNDDTVFYPIGRRVVDVDYREDLEKFIKEDEQI